jgi:hypothetical protein
VGTFTPGDYELTFSDVQAIQYLRKQLLKLQAILEASLDIAAGFKDHAIKTSDIGIPNVQVDDGILSRISIYTAQLRSHCRTVSMLLEHLEGIYKVVLSPFPLVSIFIR